MQTTEGDYGDLIRADAEKQLNYIKRLESRIHGLTMENLNYKSALSKDPRKKMFDNLSKTLAPEPVAPTEEQLAAINEARSQMMADAVARFPEPVGDHKQIAWQSIAGDPDGFGGNGGVQDAEMCRQFIVSARELADKEGCKLGRLFINFALYPNEPAQQSPQLVPETTLPDDECENDCTSCACQTEVAPVNSVPDEI